MFSDNAPAEEVTAGLGPAFTPAETGPAPTAAVPAGWRRHFFPLWSGQALSLLGSQAAHFALIWWLTETTGSATVLATASLVAFLPQVALSPLAGVAVDRWSRKRTMLASDGLVALVSLLLAWLFASGRLALWHVYAVLFARALLGVFHWPAMQASTALMVPGRHLTRVAGLNQALFGLLNIGGPALGALLIARLDLASIMLVDALTAAAAMLALALVRVPQPAGEAGRRLASIGADLRAGLAYILRWRGLLILIGMAMLIKLAITPAFALLPLLVYDHFSGDAGQLALLEGLLGGGMLGGGLALTAWGGFRRRIYTILAGLMAVSLGLLPLGLAPADRFELALAAMLVVGLSLPFIDGPLFALLQAGVAPNMQGRVFTLLSSLVGLTSPLALALAGPLSELLGLQVWYLAAGAACLLAGAAGFFVPALVAIEARGEQAVAAGPADMI
ncbi:MAG: MFS transporter [Candidatus Promineifilaceae bacterium]